MRRPPDRVAPGEARARFQHHHERLMELARHLDEAPSMDELTRLADVLPHHLDYEEGLDGLFVWLEALLPDRRDEVDALRDQHADLHERLEATRAAFDGGAADAADLAHGLVAALRDHEARESALVNAALQ